MATGVVEVDGPPPVPGEVSRDPVAKGVVVRKRFDEPMMSPR
jgi:hypothetical protein